MVYALTHAPPDRMVRGLAQKPPPLAATAAGKPRARARVIEGKDTPEVFAGRYSMHKNLVLVGVRTHFNTVTTRVVIFN